MPSRPSPPPWARRSADGLLWFTAATIPLSTTGMELGVAGLGLLSLVAIAGRWGVVRRTPLDVPIGIFLGCLVLSTLASGRFSPGPGWARMWTITAYFVVYWWIVDSDGAVRFGRTLAAAGALVALYGIVQHFTGIDWYRQALGRRTHVSPRREGDPNFAVVGFFRNYLTYAHTMTFPYAQALGLGLMTDGGWGIAALVILTAVLYSTARGAWLALIAATFAIVVLDWGRRAGALAVAAVALVLVVMGQSTALQSEVASMFALGGDNAGRLAIYQVNLAIVHDHPLFGLGFGHYVAAARPYYRDVSAADRRSHAHNNFLQIAAEGGLLSLTAFAFLFAMALRVGLEGVRGPPSPRRATAAAGWGALIGFLVGGLTQYTFGDSEVALAMWSVLGVLLRCRQDDGA